MNPTWTAVALALLTALAGCVGPVALEPAPEDVEAAAAPEPTVELVTWNGRTVGGVLDLPTHSEATEGVLFPVQQSGYLLEVVDVPTAMEVRVDWTAATADRAGFSLHPHYIVNKDESEGGTTQYYGYRSDMFWESPGCIRIPDADMAAGTWPMMVHPAWSTLDTEFTITVALVDGTAVPLDEMHGHRADGRSRMEDRGVEDCRFLVETTESEGTRELL